MDPPVEIAEGLGSQRVVPTLPVGANSDEAGPVQDPEVPGDPGLADREPRDEGAYRALATAQLLYDTQPSGIGKDSKGDVGY